MKTDKQMIKKIMVRPRVVVGVLIAVIGFVSIFFAYGLISVFEYMSCKDAELCRPEPNNPCRDVDSPECLEYCSLARNADSNTCQITCSDPNSDACALTCVGAPDGWKCKDICQTNPDSEGCYSHCQGVGDNPALNQSDCQDACDDYNSQGCRGYCRGDGGSSEICQDSCDDLQPGSTYTPLACLDTCYSQPNSEACQDVCERYSVHPLCANNLCGSVEFVAENPDTCAAACDDASNPSGIACRNYCLWASQNNINSVQCL